ncbi:MAG: sugar ABC transporter ATP-binding protein [Flexilinea sp.]
MKAISKTFPGVVALNNVNFSLAKGEVHALMGENGAGKSTLIKILTGVYQKDSGCVVLDGNEVIFPDTYAAQTAGISTVYQELNMIPYLSVGENIFLGRYPKKNKVIDWRKLYSDSQAILADMGLLNVDAKRVLHDYGTATQQMVSIARAVSLNCKVLVLDEPTSSLDAGEVNKLFSIIQNLKNRGISVIFITHRLDEVFRISNRITVLKDGEFVGTYHTNEMTQHDLVTKMIGRAISENQKSLRNYNGEDKEYIMELKDVVVEPKVKNVSIKIRKGEIVGLAGLLGSGRTETAQVTFGYTKPSSGEIFIDSKRVVLTSPKDGLNRHLAFCTENRREEGIIPNMSVRDNILLSSMNQVLSRGFINRKKGEKIVSEYVNKFQIKTPSYDQKLKNLSGGNQQKVILARWLATNPSFIIFDEPTRGIDVGAKKEVEKLIREFADMGIGVLFISSEPAEMVQNCDRIYVLRDGEVMGEIGGDDINQEKITKMIAQKQNG